MVLSIWLIAVWSNMISQNWTSEVVVWVTLMKSGPNKLADACSWHPEWVEAIVAGMVFKKSCQQCGTTGDGSEINKCVIQADHDTSQLCKYLSLHSFELPLTKRVRCGKKYAIFSTLACTLLASLSTSWKAVCQLYMPNGMALWSESIHNSLIKFETLACAPLLRPPTAEDRGSM